MRFNILKQGGHSGTDGLDAAGGNLSGPLMLFRNPVDNLEAANKQYTDTVLHTLNASNFTSGIIPVERLPAMPGDAANTDGSNVFTLGTTGVSPGSYTRVKVNSKGLVTGNEILTDSDIPELSWSKVATNKPTTLAGYGITDAITASGGVLTGPLYVTGTASSALHIVNKQYVDSIVGSGGSLSVGDTVKKATTITPSGFLKCNGGEVSQTTYSALYAIIGDTYSNNTMMPGSGRPWQQQYAINSEQSTNITGWTTGTPLPGALYKSQAVVTKNRVYLLGGSNGSAISTVYTAPINADGTLGTWTTGTSLPGGIFASQAITTKNRVYLLGGSNGSAVYTAPISGGLNDYSSYYDGTYTPITTSMFCLPDYSASELSNSITYIKY